MLSQNHDLIINDVSLNGYKTHICACGRTELEYHVTITGVKHSGISRKYTVWISCNHCGRSCRRLVTRGWSIGEKIRQRGPHAVAEKMKAAAVHEWNRYICEDVAMSC